MLFNADALRKWVLKHNCLDGEKEFQSGVLEEIEAEDYPLAAYELSRCRLPVGLTGLAECLDGEIDSGFSKLYRVWRYLAYELHLDLAEGDWIQDQIDAGQTPEFEIPTVNLEYGCYSLAGGIVFDEIDFAHWAGKRLLAFYLNPELRSINLDGGSMIPFNLGLFLHWLISQGAEQPPNMQDLLSDLAAECTSNYQQVLACWSDEKKFDSAFKNLCDKYGDLTKEPIPYNGFPVIILAVRKIRMDSDLSLPDHPLLKEPVCQLDAAKLDRKDPFFEQVDQQVSAITPTEKFKWPW